MVEDNKTSCANWIWLSLNGSFTLVSIVYCHRVNYTLNCLDSKQYLRETAQWIKNEDLQQPAVRISPSFSQIYPSNYWERIWKRKSRKCKKILQPKWRRGVWNMVTSALPPARWTYGVLTTSRSHCPLMSSSGGCLVTYRPSNSSFRATSFSRLKITSGTCQEMHIIIHNVFKSIFCSSKLFSIHLKTFRSCECARGTLRQ